MKESSDIIETADGVAELSALSREFYTEYVQSKGLYKNGQFLKDHPQYDSFSPRAPSPKRRRNEIPAPNSRSKTCPNCQQKCKTAISLKRYITMKHKPTALIE